MKHVKQLSSNTFSINEEDTIERNIKVLIERNGNITYKNYHGITFVGDIHALQTFIIKKAIEA